MIRLFKNLRYSFVELVIDVKRIIWGNRSDGSDIPGSSIFFIVGSGRNGSTLLARVLNGHSAVFLPPEQSALRCTIADWHFAFLRNWSAYYKKQLKRYLNNNQNWKLKEQDFELIERQVKGLKKAERNPKNLLKVVYKQYADRFGSGESVLGDHGPIATVRYKYLSYEFPNNKFVFLLRHPFDVVLSYKKLPNNPANDPKYACWKWNNSIKAYDHLKVQGCDIILVKYEDLVTKPESEVSKILSFLTLSQEELTKTARSAERNDLVGASELAHHQNVYKPISSESVGKWKQKLNHDTIIALKKMVQKNADRFGYDLTN